MSDYDTLLAGGFSHEEIRGYLHPKLAEAGFADQEINAWFNTRQAPSDAALAFADSWGAYLDKDAGGLCPARTWGDTGGAAPHPDMSSMGQAVHDNMRDGSDFFLHGLQGSASGLSARKTMPDAVSDERMQQADVFDRLLLSAGTLLGDAPYIAAGAVPWMTTLNPAIALGAGFGTAGYVRALQMELIRQGKTTEETP